MKSSKGIDKEKIEGESQTMFTLHKFTTLEKAKFAEAVAMLLMNGFDGWSKKWGIASWTRPCEQITFLEILFDRRVAVSDDSIEIKSTAGLVVLWDRHDHRGTVRVSFDQFMKEFRANPKNINITASVVAERPLFASNDPRAVAKYAR